MRLNRLIPLVLLLIASPALAQEQVTLTPSKDATLYESSTGNIANGAGQYVFAGMTNGGVARRALLEFDVSDIPAGSTILSAELELTMSRTISGGEPVAVHRVDESWNEGPSDASLQEGAGTSAQAGDVTWVHREFPSVEWTTPGGVFSEGASAQATVGGTGRYTWSSEGLAADVQSWIETPVANFGWVLIGNESATGSAKRFDSRDAASAAARPTLTITYSPGSTAVEEAELPRVASLGQNHPNPFHDATTIRWSLAEAATARVEVFDLLGRKVATVVSGRHPAGDYETRFQADGLPDGVYLYRLESGGRVETRQMVLLR